MKKNANIILGSYINGYSIVQELYENGVKDDIIVIDIVKDVSAYSKKVKRFIKIYNNIDSLHSALKNLSNSYKLLILYPNQDIYIEYLTKLYIKVKNYCFIPFYQPSLIEKQNKMVQYDYCKKYEIPFPTSVYIEYLEDINKIYDLDFPILIKPTQRDNSSTSVFRNLFLKNKKGLNLSSKLSRHINNGVSFVASEVIPGDGSNIYSYMSYRSKEGEILGEWTGKKLSQFPNDFGVFSSASNNCPEIVAKQGRKILEVMNLFGINQPEFKYDFRDKKYKLTEINLRPMMWHRLGAITGVPLSFIQYLSATNKNIPDFIQNKNDKINYIYINHELINLIYRSNYFMRFKSIIFSKNKNYFALWDFNDPGPFFYSFISIINKYFRYKKRTNI